MTRKIGYARVSTADQNLDRQIAALRTEGVDLIYREKASGKSVDNRPELEKAIDQLGTGDVLVLAEWDRATRPMMDGVHLIDRIAKRGALLKVLDNPTSTSPHRSAAGSSRSSAPWLRTSAFASTSVPAKAARPPVPKASTWAASPS
jgi:DNA invertase Pin-like site-specific DNA recombinase